MSRGPGCPPTAKRALIQRGMSAFSALDVRVTGFRPPGGGLNPASSEILRAAGVTWCSPEGSRFEVRDGLAYVPFEWKRVDAYLLMDEFAELRVAHGEPREPLAATQAEQRLLEGLDGDEARTLIMHPFLMLEPDWWAAARRLLSRIAGDRIVAVPGGAVAAAVARRD